MDICRSVIADNWQYLFGAYPDGARRCSADHLINIIGYCIYYFINFIGGIAPHDTQEHLVNLFAAFRFFTLFRHYVDILGLFLLPVVLGMEIPEITTVICALALITSSYIAHGVKAGILAIGKISGKQGYR